ncbi:hypothetical protein ACFQU3_19900 [Terrabacter sp. GCM10028922]
MPSSTYEAAAGLRGGHRGTILDLAGNTAATTTYTETDNGNDF